MSSIVRSIPQGNGVATSHYIYIDTEEVKKMLQLAYAEIAYREQVGIIRYALRVTFTVLLDAGILLLSV